jgi:four helix bundle protein
VGEYRKLAVWERAHRLTLAIYAATRTFPNVEAYGLTGQLRRAASSIPANLAEGSGRRSDAELARFATMALGSATELDYHLLLARDLSYIAAPQYDHLAAETQGVSRMLASLIDTLRRTNHRKPMTKSQ